MGLKTPFIERDLYRQNDAKAVALAVSIIVVMLWDREWCWGVRNGMLRAFLLFGAGVRH